MDIRRLKSLYSEFQIYGFLLGLTHLVTHLFWSAYDFTEGLAYKLANPTGNNWPFIPPQFPLWIAEHSKLVVVTYIALSFLTIFIFLIPRAQLNLLRATFAVSFFLKLLIYFSSYDFMGNYQYMAHIVFFLFLFAPTDLRLIRLAILLFYFGAGLIKLNWEWISGSALLIDTFIPQPWLTIGCIYVIILELVFVWFIDFKKHFIHFAVFAQLVFFHLFSWHIVGFYYPSIMLLMISVFLISSEPLFERSFLKNKITLIYSFLFLSAQAYPKVLAKNEALTAEGRMLSLNMLDAKTICLPSFEIQTDLGYLYIDQPMHYATRVRCDPLVWFNYGKKLCQNAPMESISLTIRGRKTTDSYDLLTVDHVNICDPQIKYSIFSNDWIQSKEIPHLIQEPIHKVRHWRNNIQRTGYLNVESHPQKIRGSSEYPKQWGIHGAAHSSPILLSENHFVVGTDSNSVMIISDGGQIKSTFFSESSEGIFGSPATINDHHLLIGNYNGTISLIDSLNSRRIWSIRHGDAIGSSPLIINDKAYITVEHLPDSSQLIELDIRTGQIHFKSELHRGLAHSSVSSDQKSLFFGTNSGFIVAYDLEQKSLKWQTLLDGKVQGTPAIFNDLLYSFTSTGTLAAIDTQNGEIKHSQQLLAGGRGSPSIDERNKLVIVPLINGEIQARSLDLSELIWSFKAPLQLTTSGLITDDQKTTLYWTNCDENRLCAIDTTNGKIVQKHSIGGNFSSSPDYYNGTLIITLDDQKGSVFLRSN